VLIGLSRPKAREYALRCLVSTGEMLLRSGRPSESVKEDVCSPAGAAIQGVRAFEAAGGRNAVFDAIVATDAQYRKLGDIG
jgi:pyrroline-5-carboxylate reductase